VHGSDGALERSGDRVRYDRRMVKRCIVILALLAIPASADPPAIKGTFGFDWSTPKRSRCAAITGALLTRLTKDYVCAPPKAGSASGVAIVATCTAKKGHSEFMLFASAKDCTEERETQLANGE
jgi:hypothetical protein